MNNSYIVAHKDNKIYGMYGLEVNKDSFLYLEKNITNIVQDNFNNTVFINNIMKMFHYYLLDNYRPYNKYQVKLLEKIVEESLFDYIQSYDNFKLFTDKEFDDIIFSYKLKYNFSLMDILEEYSFATSIEFVRNVIKFILTYYSYNISLIWR